MKGNIAVPWMVWVCFGGTLELEGLYNSEEWGIDWRKIQRFKVQPFNPNPVFFGTFVGFMWVFPKTRGIPKWMVYNGNPIKNGWFGGNPPIFGNTHVYFGTLENWFTTGIFHPDRLITGIFRNSGDLKIPNGDCKADHVWFGRFMLIHFAGPRSFWQVTFWRVGHSWN